LPSIPNSCILTDTFVKCFEALVETWRRSESVLDDVRENGLVEMGEYISMTNTSLMAKAMQKGILPNEDVFGCCLDRLIIDIWDTHFNG
jgi:hypothetical protein